MSFVRGFGSGRGGEVGRAFGSREEPMMANDEAREGAGKGGSTTDD